MTAKESKIKVKFGESYPRFDENGWEIPDPRPRVIHLESERRKGPFEAYLEKVRMDAIRRELAKDASLPFDRDENDIRMDDPDKEDEVFEDDIDRLLDEDEDKFFKEAEVGSKPPPPAQKGPEMAKIDVSRLSQGEKESLLKALKGGSPEGGEPPPPPSA